MTADRPPALTEYRIQARQLLKEVRQPDSEETLENSLTRFRVLSSFADKTEAQVIRDAKLKHALTVISVERGYGSWRALKVSLQTAGPAMYAGELDVFLNRWFASYEDARASLEKEGGFLLPYGHQFFVCEESAIRGLGLDPDDPDWELAGYDWIRPRDQQAWARLVQKREQAPLSE